ncbi:MAG: sigma-70 family RNA polymerase sigma factor [Thermoguttaceae bacterium]|nr:sigma-70 family RNA polymerase sigma factor [Thermoguttaceae bacterium]
MDEQADKNSLMNQKASLLFLKYHHFVEMTAFHNAPHPSLQGDIVNSVYIEFVQKADKWDLDRDVKPLLKRITELVALRFWKDYVRNLPKSLQTLADYLTPKNTPSESETDIKDQAALLDECIERLPLKSRSLLKLHYSEGTSLVEIAKSMNMKPDAIYAAVSRIRKSLRDCISTKLGQQDDFVGEVQE